MRYYELFAEALYLWFLLRFIEFCIVRRPLASVYPLFLGVGLCLMIIEALLSGMGGGLSYSIKIVALAAVFPVVFLMVSAVSGRIHNILLGDSLVSVWVMSLLFSTGILICTLQEKFVDYRYYWWGLLSILHVLYCISYKKKKGNSRMANNTSTIEHSGS